MSNLIDDIKRAREELRRRKEEASDAGFTLKSCQAEQRKAQTTLDELLDELVSGQSKYPIFERIERNGTHDEYQRGPTAFPEVQSRQVGISAEPQSPPEAEPGKRARKKPAAE